MVRAAILGALVLAGCAYNKTSLKQRASADLNCPESELAITQTDAEHRKVRGCGHQAVYKVGQDGWVASAMDGKSTGTAPDAGAPQPPTEPPPTAVHPVPPLAAPPPAGG